MTGPSAAWPRRRAWLLLLALIVPAVEAQAPDTLRAHPGFVDLEAGDLFSDEDLSVHLSIKEAMLGLVAAAARESEPELAAMIEGLIAGEVRVFETDATSDPAVRRTIKETSAKLRKRGWDPAIDIRLDGAQGFLYFRFDGGPHPVGLAGMFLEQDGEAVFLNIVGTIDPALIGRLASKFNIKLLGEDSILPPAESGG